MDPRSVKEIKLLMEAFRNGSSLPVAVSFIEKMDKTVLKENIEIVVAPALLPKKVLVVYQDVYKALGYSMGSDYNHSLAHLVGSLIADAMKKDEDVLNKLGGFSYFSATKNKKDVEDIVEKQLKKLGGEKEYKAAVIKVAELLIEANIEVA